MSGRASASLALATRSHAMLYLFMAPFAISTALFGIWPIAESIRVAFTDSYSALSSDPRYVGFDNFRTVLSAPAFHDSLWRTLLYTALAVPINVVSALGLALLLSHPVLKHGRTAFKLAIFVPAICPETASYIVLKSMFNQNYGVVNHVLLGVGLPAFGGLTAPGSAFATLLLIETWNHVGLYALIFLTNFQLLDKSLEEAAAIDGASRWQSLVNIVIPQLRPAIAVTSIYALIEFLKTFSVIYIVSRGGPNFSTSFVSYLAWMKFSSAQYGEATAIATILFVIVFVASGGAYLYASRSDHR